MRYLLLSDIHSNDEALAAVLARARRRRFDRVVILGDFVANLINDCEFRCSNSHRLEG